LAHELHPVQPREYTPEFVQAEVCYPCN
jgi:hypothetical protein